MSESKAEDIADALGVNIVTASNALSGKKASVIPCGKNSREGKELGYDADKYNTEAERALPSVLSYPGVTSLSALHFTGNSIRKTAYAASKKHSFTMLEIVTYEDGVQCVPPQMLSSDEIEGIIVIGRMDGAYMKKSLPGL